MIKVYFKELSDFPFVPLLQTYKDQKRFNRNNAYIKGVLDSISTVFVSRVDSISDADFILFPHYYYHVRSESAYIAEQVALSVSAQKPLLLFLFEDEVFDIDWSNTFILRSSAYHSLMRSNEISLPPIVADLSEGRNVAPLSRPVVPIVGFVGWAGFNNRKRAIKANIKNLLVRTAALFYGSLYQARKQQGIFLRRYLLKLVKSDSRVVDASIVRSAYAGFTRDFSPELIKKQREEYIDNMITSHFTLAPRGDGNFSQRFFECLSVGRFPVLIDTDSALPLADVIPYERFVVMVPYKERSKTVDYIMNFVNSLDDDEFIKRQEEAKYYFDNYLSVKGYYSYMFVEEHIRDYVKAKAS